MKNIHDFDEFLTIFELQMVIKKIIVRMYFYNFRMRVRTSYVDPSIKFSSNLSQLNFSLRSESKIPFFVAY